MEIIGLVAFRAKLLAWPEAVSAAAGRALYQAGESMMTASKQNHRYQNQTGNLQASGTVDQPTGSGVKTSVKLHYDAPYALFVHEGHRIVAWGHETGRRTAPDKFLESAVMGGVGEASRTVGAAVKAVLH